uniref:Uncharacterized protein n=1 Tax=Vombatus ursinus TaxID=29139 RepID=A0A4X2KNB1_VOMUR
MPEMPLLCLVPHLCQLCPRCPPSARPLSSTVCLMARHSNYYELLGIHPDASTKEVKGAFFFAKSKELPGEGDRGPVPIWTLVPVCNKVIVSGAQIPNPMFFVPYCASEVYPENDGTVMIVQGESAS